jgi:hypothetical protein
MREMHDTSPEMAALYIRLLAERSGEERFLMGCDMFDTSRALVCAGLTAESPWKSEEELRVRLFLRFYGRDFPPDERDRIVEALRNWERRNVDTPSA